MSTVGRAPVDRDPLSSLFREVVLEPFREPPIGGRADQPTSWVAGRNDRQWYTDRQPCESVAGPNGNRDSQIDAKWWGYPELKDRGRIGSARWVTTSSLDFRLHALGCFADDFVLPHTHYTPTCCIENPIVASVSPHIGKEFRCPPSPIRLRHRAVLWASMPKTTVNEYGDMLTQEDKIRSSACKAIQRWMELVAVASPVKLSSKFYLDISILLRGTTHARRDRRGGSWRGIAIGHTVYREYLDEMGNDDPPELDRQLWWHSISYHLAPRRPLWSC